MEAVLGAEVAPQRRPGWWRTAWALFVAAWLGFGVLLLLSVPLWFAAIEPRTDAADHPWVFVPAGGFAIVAGLGYAAFALSVLTLMSSWVLNAWLEREVAPTWVALGIGLGGFSPFYAGPLASGGATGFLISIVVVRFAGFDADGRPRPGMLVLWEGGSRVRVRRALTGALFAGLAVACAYGMTHPAGASSSWSGSGPRAIRTAQGPVREIHLPVQPRGPGQSTLLAVRPAGDAAGRTRVVAVGRTPGGPVGVPPTGLPVLAEDGVAVWLAAPVCPAPAVTVDRVDVRVRSWSGTHWVPLRLEPAMTVRCVR